MTEESPLSPEKFEEIAIVSRETMDRLRIYADCLAEWQQTLNLVSRNSLAHVWDRHMLDSIQLVRHLPEGATSITDIGSGAGFPGLVLAIATGLPTELVESHVRKSAFLREAAALTQAPAEVLTARVEDIAAARRQAGGRKSGKSSESAGESAGKPVDVLTARALAPLSKLCEMADSLGAQTCLFMKGGRWREELTEAEKRWRIKLQTFESLTSPEGRILRITGLKKR
jgi:16S rRNA (guanine527-N7)-methyltransferase